MNIGGLPFLPSATSLVTNLLDELISDSPESAFERTTLPAGIEDRLKSVNWDKREVLIGYVPDQKQLKHYLGSKKYFTSRFDIANLPVHYVALYEKAKGICWYGEVISWEKVKRSSIPGTGNQRGHKFKVLGWKKLTNPIHVAEYAPNPISYTNFFLLSHCSSYSELLLKSEADYRFFTELKRRTNQAVVEGTEDSTAFEFGKAKVQFKDNNIYVYRDQDIVEECTVQDFVKRPNATFRRLQKYVEEIGEATESTGTD